jgi:hypothetical protein
MGFPLVVSRYVVIGTGLIVFDGSKRAGEDLKKALVNFKDLRPDSRYADLVRRKRL